MGAGEIYAALGANLGNDISGAMTEYHKRHVEYDQQMKIAEALGNIGYTPNGGFVPNIAAAGEAGQKAKPIIDPKYLDMLRTKNQSEWDKNTGALKVLNQIGVHTYAAQLADQLHRQSATGQMQQKALDTPFFTMPDPVTGQPVMGRNTPSGAVLQSGGATNNAQAGIAQRFQINQAIKLRKELAKGISESGFQPEDFLSPKVVGGVQDSSGKYVPVDSSTGVQPQVYGIPDEKGQPQWFPAAEFSKDKTKAQQYQQLGQVAFSGLSGGKQSAPVMVKTPAEAAALLPGTLVQTPDGRVGRTKGAAAAPAETESATEDSGETGEE